MTATRSAPGTDVEAVPAGAGPPFTFTDPDGVALEIIHLDAG